MIQAIPTKYRPLTVRIEIMASAPATIGVYAYDPHHANTFYMKRKLAFSHEGIKAIGRQSRTISIALPVSPNLLMVEVFNKATGGDHGFKAKITGIEPLKTGEVWASQPRHRFMDFAIDFAKKAGYIKPGFYDSLDHEFLIQYLPTITDDQGNELITPARIHRHMPRVQLSRKVFRQFSVPVRVAILAHEACHYFLNTRSEITADTCGIKYYLESGFPKIEAQYAVTKVFAMHPESIGEAHIERAKNMMSFIDTFIANEKLQAA